MGHPEPFDLRYVAVGNEECFMLNYTGMHFFKAHMQKVNNFFMYTLTSESSKWFLKL